MYNVQVDAIVNTCNADIDLTRGAVSQAILEAAGHDMQDECNIKRPVNFGPGDMISTRGFGLKAKFVYHGAVKAWDGGMGRSEQVGLTLIGLSYFYGNVGDS